MFNYLLLVVILIIINPSSSKNNANKYSKEIDINWWNILNAEVSCCPQHTDKADCDNEGGSSCQYLPADDPIAVDAGSQCLGTSYVDCKTKKGITACCSPGCQGNTGNPNNPVVNPPGQPNPPVCFSKVTPAPVTPAPVTPAPVTPRPTTPAPVTPAPTTPRPTTPRPTTPRPTTPAPVTPAPVTPRPTTPSPTTPNPTTPSPTTPRPTTPRPTTPAPVTPAPVTPAPVTPAPVTPAPVTPAPVTPAPVTPAPVTPAPTTPAPVEEPAGCSAGNDAGKWGKCGGDNGAYNGPTCCGYYPSDQTGQDILWYCKYQSVWYSQCSPCEGADANLPECTGNAGGGGNNETPAPVTPAPVTPAPVTPAPVTPAPVNQTPAPVTPAPVNQTPAPVTPAPVTPSPITEGGGGGNEGGGWTNTPTDSGECKHMADSSGANNEYAFEGFGCQVSGDPHFFMWNGFVHDFMGRPSKSIDGKAKDQFYYVTQCPGRSTEMMPFRIVGRQYNLWDEIVSGLDYLVFELFDTDGSTYYFFLSPDFKAYAKKGDNGVSTHYDNIPSGSLTNVAVGTTSIGNRFSVTITETGTDYKAVDLKLEIGHGANTYTNSISISCQSKDNTRCRQTYANIKIDSYYKCRACGLCGDFITGKVYGKDVKQPIRTCDDQFMDIGYGAAVPEAHDINGLTYERNYWLNDCVSYVGADFTYVSPCDENNDAFTLAVKNACADRAHVWADCCREVSDECTAIQKDCNYDTCVMATDNGVGDQSKIAAASIEAFDNAMSKLCSLPTEGDGADPYANCKLQYEQCGGNGYTGETCCKQGFACFGTSWPPSACKDGESWCACGEDATQTSGCSAAWQQCGGKEWKGPTCCNHGYVCIWDTDYYSQCLPVKTVTTHKNNKKDDSQFMVAIDSMNIQLNDTFHTVDMDYFKIGGITFGILSVLVMIYLYKKKQENKDGDYIAIDDQKYGEIIPNYRAVV